MVRGKKRKQVCVCGVGVGDDRKERGCEKKKETVCCLGTLSLNPRSLWFGVPLFFLLVL